jgi:hypothetical protein
MDERTFLRSALVDAIAGEHRMRRQSLHEQREAERWTERAELAERRGLTDLAQQARSRADRHARMVSVISGQIEAMRIEVERLRALEHDRPSLGRAPPTVRSTVESELAALEIEGELDRLKRRDSGSADPVRSQVGTRAEMEEG